MADAPADKPWHVYVVSPSNGSGFHSGHDTEDEAEGATFTANTEAQRLGITARYEARPRDVA